ncbi:hypothetical protein DERP_009468 [Dermatophagoides pteronyssinus]|uniref:Uncharacterized protein n=1 Tax=Dermatophagoides pteronyssinus TaxID=6956 RepID=A0ABQ8IU81_DERPT|nr:hypothetical protein DERP_009468 [Dermatophagoides pteronyssinus]
MFRLGLDFFIKVALIFANERFGTIHSPAKTFFNKRVDPSEKLCKLSFQFNNLLGSGTDERTLRRIFRPKNITLSRLRNRGFVSSVNNSFFKQNRDSSEIEIKSKQKSNENVLQGSTV